jgi:hypothetical protein
MRYVEQDGVRGVWVSDRDGGGDDFSFFKLDFATRTAQKQELTLAGAKAFALDNDPVADANSNDGNVDFFDVDENGKLIIGESGFYDSPQTEPKIITHEVTNYNTSPTRITRGGWTATAPITIAQDDDADVVNGRFGTFERGKDYAYYFDIDSGAEPSVRADVYVVDVATGQVVYEELDAINHFTVENKIRFFTLGDYVGSDDSIINGDGIVNADDIDAQAARIADPTQGGRYSAAVGNEMFDLDGDNMLTTGNPLGFFSISGDRDYLIRRVLGTEYGDADLNGLLDAGDQAQLDFGISFGLDRWDFGDYDGDGDADADDQAILDFALAFNPNPIRI